MQAFAVGFSKASSQSDFMAILTEFDNINVENSHGVLFPCGMS